MYYYRHKHGHTHMYIEKSANETRCECFDVAFVIEFLLLDSDIVVLAVAVVANRKMNFLNFLKLKFCKRYKSKMNKTRATTMAIRTINERTRRRKRK